MNKLNLFIVLIACASCVCPALAVSRWFSSSFHDLKYALRRYGHCVPELSPIRDYNMNETDYLIHQIRVFLDQGNYDNEQLSNVTALMDNICRNNIDTNYAISAAIDVSKYNSTTSGKETRCRAIDEAMDPMYYVFKRASLNRSEPLDFSVIQFRPNPTDRTATYNLTDLINTSWITSETILEHVCKITGSVKEYVHARTSLSAAQQRFERTGALNSLIEFLDRLLDPILGLERRLYWEGTNRLGQISHRINNGLGSLRDGIGRGVKSTRDRVSNLFTQSLNSTRSAPVNSSSVSLNSSTPLSLAQPLLPRAPVPPVALSVNSSISNFVSRPPAVVNSQT